MRLVVYEPQFTGHHYAYLSHLLPALAELTPNLVLATSESGASSRQFDVHLAAHTRHFKVAKVLSGPFRQGVNNVRQLYGGLRHAVRQLAPDHLYVPYGDSIGIGCGLTAAIGIRTWPAVVEAEVLLMRGNYIYPNNDLRSRLKGQASLRLLCRGDWSVIHHLDPQALKLLAMRNHDEARYRLMPDPVETIATVNRAAARAKLDIPMEGRYFGTAGLIHRLKGIDLLLQAFRDTLPQLRPDDKLLLAGPQVEEMKGLLESRYRDLYEAGRIVTVPRHLSTTEMATALAALDVVCTLYPKHLHSASIVIQAAAVERPVLGANQGWMERTIRQFRLGDTCQVDDRAALAAALPVALNNAPSYQSTHAAKAFVRFHSPENFAAHWTARLRERLGLPPSPHFMPWDDVLKAFA